MISKPFLLINTITNTVSNNDKDGLKQGMTKSFILIEVDEDLKEATKEAIRKHPAVSGVYTVVDGGDEESIIYDIVVKVEADTRRDLDDAESEIRTRKEVRSTLTLEVIEKEDAANTSEDRFLQT
jgi:hypothetical protein